MLASPEIIALVLLAALLHATWNTLVKTGSDRTLVLGAVNATGVLAGLIVIPFAAAPDPASWIYIGLSVALHLGYYYFLLQAYRVGDLSHVYPLARGTAPILVLVGAALLAGEVLPGLANLGALLACFGIMSLAFENGLPWKDDYRPLFFAMVTSIFIAGYTITDGIGVRLSGSPLGYICWLYVIDGIAAVLAVWYVRRGRVVKFLSENWWTGLGGGLAALTAYGLVIYAMSTTAMGAVAALRETSVIMAVLIGTFALGERFGRRRLIAASVVAAGVGLMHWR